MAVTLADSSVPVVNLQFRARVAADFTAPFDGDFFGIEMTATPSRSATAHVPTAVRIGHNPAEVLGSRVVQGERPSWAVHFKKTKAVTEKTAKALASMIMAATVMLDSNEGD